MHPCHLQLGECLAFAEERLHHRLVKGLNEVLLTGFVLPLAEDQLLEALLWDVLLQDQ